MADRLVIAGNLVLDATAAEVADAFAAAGVECILLRGPAQTEWLYGAAEARASSDVDLLIPRSSRRAAEHVLRDLGYRRHIGATPGVVAEYAENWLRHGRASIDLHWTILGARAPAERVWEVFRPRVERREVLGSGLLVPAGELRPLLVVLHAGKHGGEHRRTLRDLERVLELVSLDEWRAVAEVAERLDAVELLAAGLRLLPAGAAIADELSLPEVVSPLTALHLQSLPPTSRGFRWLAETPGLGARARLLWFKLVPPADFMRDWRPLARRGRLGLALTYVYRWFWLARWVGPGFLAWRRARRASDASRQEP